VLSDGLLRGCLSVVFVLILLTSCYPGNTRYFRLQNIVQFGMLFLVLSKYTTEMRRHDLSTICYFIFNGSNWIFVSRSAKLSLVS